MGGSKCLGDRDDRYPMLVVPHNRKEAHLSQSPKPPPDLTIDVISACVCCSIDAVDWREFLEHFAENAPDRGTPSMLRFRAGASRRDARVGVISYACGNGH